MNQERDAAAGNTEEEEWDLVGSWELRGDVGGAEAEHCKCKTQENSILKTLLRTWPRSGINRGAAELCVAMLIGEKGINNGGEWWGVPTQV